MQSVYGYSGLLTSVTEFSQMFQMLDDELGTDTQFAFDNFRQQSEEIGKNNSFGHAHGKNRTDSIEVIIALNLTQ